MSEPALAPTFTEYAARKIEDHFYQIRRCAGLLSEEQLWFRPNPHSNSVGNLLLHLNGNISQWVLAGIGGRTIHRDRQAEFDAKGPMPLAKSLAPLTATIAEACWTLRARWGADVAGERKIQDYRVTGLAGIGGRTIHRDRQAEFDAKGPSGRDGSS